MNKDGTGYAVLYRFDDTVNDGQYPYAGLQKDRMAPCMARHALEARLSIAVWSFAWGRIRRPCTSSPFKNSRLASGVFEVGECPGKRIPSRRPRASRSTTGKQSERPSRPDPMVPGSLTIPRLPPLAFTAPPGSR